MRKAAVAVGGGGGSKGAAATTDLLVCFPARQRLALMPKPICSPSRATMDKAAAARRRSQMPGVRSSPMFRGSSKAKRTAGQEEEEDEPQSPKVTCAGQIKVGRPKKARAVTKRKVSGKGEGGGGGKSWITVVEEIERMHGRRKKVGCLEAVGIRRDALPFLGGVMRGLRHKVRCLGSLHGAVDSSTDDEDGADEEHDGEPRAGGSAAASVFSKWLMVLEGGEEPSEHDSREDDEERDDEDHEEPRSKEADECELAPPPNALLLMRCRSAPAKGLSRRVAAEPPASEAEEERGSAHAVAEDAGTEDARDDDLVFMSSAPGFLKLSIDIAKETWIVGGGDPLSRSRSWKR